jgi:hypothetical protein
MPGNDNFDSAPESVNSEQEDADTQAQTLADERRLGSDLGLEDSDKPHSGDEDDDVPDLVDHMQQMASSGRLDYDAYRGERSDDDEDGMLGEAGED